MKPSNAWLPFHRYHIRILLQIILFFVNNSWIEATTTTPTNIINKATNQIEKSLQLNTESNSFTSIDALPTALPLKATSSATQYVEGIVKHNQTIIEFNQTKINSNDTNEFLATAAALRSDGQIGCSLSEFTCTNLKCIPTNKYCDRSNDCGDNSDEPRFCTRK